MPHFLWPWLFPFLVNSRNVSHHYTLSLKYVRLCDQMIRLDYSQRRKIKLNKVRELFIVNRMTARIIPTLPMMTLNTKIKIREFSCKKNFCERK